MRVRHCTVAAAALAVLVASACAPEAPDYQSILSTTPTTTTTTTEPGSEPPLPIATYLEQKGVVGEPIPADKLTDLTVTYPTPPGWKPFVNSNLSPGTRVIAKGTTYPMAMVIVFKLNGDFDVNEAIGHGYVDAEMSENFKRLNASMDNFRGFPSSMIEGSYDLNGSRMHTYNRIVIATGAPPANQRYLIQFTVTGYAEKAAEEAPDIEAIIKGFNVTVPKTPPK
ncbi:LpqN/LpqT family lipoprotein [Mycobacterium sp. 2YAF39]|uniref:LpqN/LpqT family lipoprotein n=1 Tax=Mycobacterium sp. 2YAF39 TaxID=3233033 RepID=UPI003F9E08F3